MLQSLFPFGPRLRLRQIVSGGQTGVDRAALDVAIELGIEQGGYCPRGRRAEDGRIADRYRLTETDSDRYDVRTRLNVMESDGTLILFRDQLSGGTRLTSDVARSGAKPCLRVNLNRPHGILAARRWLSENEIVTLNVAGPRESQAEGIHEQATAWLRELLHDFTLQRGGHVRA